MGLLLLLCTGALAQAHVSVRPRQSTAGAEQRYTVRVPTEGTVATASVHLEVPEGVRVSSVEPVEGTTIDLQREGERITGITWARIIPPKAAAEFILTAHNPAQPSELVWRAHQHLADGTVIDWVGPTGDRRPAPRVTLSPAPAGASGQSEASQVQAWLAQYPDALNGRNLDRLATFYHPDVTIFEGAGVNTGWVDYRDHHLGPELTAFETLQFTQSDSKVFVAEDGRTAYATFRYTLKAQLKERQVDVAGLGTFVLVKDASRAWKIRHAHTSSRPVARPPI